MKRRLLKACPREENWELDSPIDDPSLVKEFVKEILSFITKNHSNWRQAFKAQSDLQNHEATERIIEDLQMHPEGSIDIDELEEIRTKSIAE